MFHKRKKHQKSNYWKLKKWIILIGLPGCGKSTLGLSLAKLLNVPFYDSDAEVVRISNMKIPEIFAQYGEDEFRRLENLVITRLLNENTPAILALGGGAFENKETQKLIKKNAFSVWLNVEHDIIIQRVTQRSGRPMFDNTDCPEQLLKELASKRDPNFKKANIQFVPSNSSINSAARSLHNVLKKFSLFRRP